MSGSPPEISVVIPCYNAERFVGEAVESALGQRGVRHEVIVVDDGSTDGSSAVLERFRRHIVLIRQENRGEGGARNRGIAAARGRYLAFLDADDWWDPSFLE
ncbi:MAG TPA: glycosyltransferase family 2 protein, partial [Chromatiales bacterium]|nr:glycosyltransferase family 2 protein [Chromatiales bacterium]